MVDVLAIMDCFFFKTRLGFLMAIGLSIQTDLRVWCAGLCCNDMEAFINNSLFILKCCTIKKTNLYI